MDLATYFSKVFELQDENGCWNVLREGDRYYPELNYYVPNYKSTLWTLILLADLELEPSDVRVKRALAAIEHQFFDESNGIYTIGKSHFPIPCLNGNMLYLLSYFNADVLQRIEGVVDFFYEHQRFDDGDFKTPRVFPYFGNTSCYGKHTCYWGIVKLLKGLSFIPLDKRSEKANALIKRCVDFILMHEVCYSSRLPSQLICKGIDQLTFPNMYHSDFLEILWILDREHVKCPQMDRAIDLLAEKKTTQGDWKIERKIKELVVPFGRSQVVNEAVTARASRVLENFTNKEN